MAKSKCGERRIKYLDNQDIGITRLDSLFAPSRLENVKPSVLFDEDEGEDDKWFDELDVEELEELEELKMENLSNQTIIQESKSRSGELTIKKFSDLTIFEATKKIFSPLVKLSSLFSLPSTMWASEVPIFVMLYGLLNTVVSSMIFCLDVKYLVVWSLFLLVTCLTNVISKGFTKATINNFVFAFLPLFLGTIVYEKGFTGIEIQNGIIKSYTASELKGKEFIIIPDKKDSEFKTITLKPDGVATIATSSSDVNTKWSFKDENDICLDKSCMTIYPRGGRVFSNDHRYIGQITLTPPVEIEKPITSSIEEIIKNARSNTTPVMAGAKSQPIKSGVSPAIILTETLQPDADTAKLTEAMKLHDANTPLADPGHPIQITNDTMDTTKPISMGGQNYIPNLAPASDIKLAQSTLETIMHYDFAHLYTDDNFASMKDKSGFSPPIMQDFLNILMQKGYLKLIVNQRAMMDFKILPELNKSTVQAVISLTSSIDDEIHDGRIYLKDFDARGLSVNKSIIDIELTIQGDHVVNITEYKP
jgi:hypothetical protein